MASGLTYSVTPHDVAVSTGNAVSKVPMTFTVTNATTATMNLESLTFTLPQGSGDTDLIPLHSSISGGSVQSPAGTSWSLSAQDNQATLTPVSSEGYAPLAPNASLQFTISGVQIVTAGAGHTATIAVSVSVQDQGDAGSGAIGVDKVDPGFQIVDFSSDLYNVSPNGSITIDWNVFRADSCDVTATILGTAAGGTGGSNPTADGTISSGSDLDDSRSLTIVGPTLFTLTAHGRKDGADVDLTSQFLVTVNEPAINFQVFPPVVSLGQPVSLTWVAADAAVLTLYIAPVSGDAPDPKTLTATPAGTLTDTPTVDTSYTLCAFSSASAPKPAQQQLLSVRVQQPEWTKPPVVSNLPSPAYPGDTFTLDWQVNHAASCSLSSDVTAFGTQNLQTQGPATITLPDPAVPSGTVNFSLVPAEFGGLGTFTPQPFAVPVQNTPHFSKPLAADQTTVAPGAAVNLSWTVDHADSGTLTNNYPGSAAVPIANPASGAQAVTAPAAIIPVRLTYTLTASRQRGKYTSASDVVITTKGSLADPSWLRIAANATPGFYLPLDLPIRFPNTRIKKVGAFGFENLGISSIQVWFTNNEAPDYYVGQTIEMYNTPPPTVFPLQSGEYLSGITCVFGNGFPTWDPSPAIAPLVGIGFAMSSGRTESFSVPYSGTCYPPVATSAPGGQQVIGFGGGFVPVKDYDILDTVGVYLCPSSYGT